MGLDWTCKTMPGQQSLLAKSDAKSWRDLTKDVSAAMLKFFELVASNAEERRYVLLVSLWNDSGKVALHFHQKGKLVSSAPLILQIYNGYMQESYEAELALCSEQDKEALARHIDAFDATVQGCLMDACRIADVRDAWGRVLERVVDCQIYVQQTDDDNTRRKTYMVIPPS